MISTRMTMYTILLALAAGCATLPDDMPEPAYRLGNSSLQRCRGTTPKDTCVCACDAQHPWVLWRTDENDSCVQKCE